MAEVSLALVLTKDTRVSVLFSPAMLLCVHIELVCKKMRVAQPFYKQSLWNLLSSIARVKELA